MRALFNRQKEKYKKEWYDSKGMEQPTLNTKRKFKKKNDPMVQTLTNTYVIEHFSKTIDPKNLNLSYWEGEGAGIEPSEFRASLNVLRSDFILSEKKPPLFKFGELNRCYTPYENDLLTFKTYEATRKELKRRADQLAYEMERVDKEFNRNPVTNWFCIKNKDFTTEHCRYLEKQRRRAAKKQFKDYYEAEEKEFHED